MYDLIMEGFFSFFANPWVVGIGTGAISGLSVNIISRLILTRKDNKEFKQKTSSANNEIIYSLRSAVAEASMPKEEIIESIARATAQKYEVKRDSLMSLTEITDALIKEVMDSNFLSQDQKDKYTTKIVSVITKASKKHSQTHERINEDLYLRHKRNLSYRYINYLSLVTATMVVVVTSIGFGDQSIFRMNDLNVGGELLPLIVATLIIPIFAVLTLRDNSIINAFVSGLAGAISGLIEGIASAVSRLFERPKKK